MRIRRAPRAALVVAGALVAAAFSLVAGTNVVLRADWLLGQIDADPSTLFVTYSAPRSLLPGFVRFDTLTVRSRDSNVEWEARLEDVSIRFSVAELVSRRFRATRLRANALTFRLRERLDPADATPPRVARYPRIAGFAEPPLRDPPAAPAEPGNPWRIIVGDLRVENVREIWIDSWRWEGSARLEGGFMLLPGREAEVTPAELALSGGTLRFGPSDAALQTAGSVRARLPRFDTQAYPGNEVWKIMSGGASLDASLAGLEFLSADGDGARFGGGRGTARVRLNLSSGRGSGQFDFDAHGIVARAGTRVLRGGARMDVKAERIDFHDGTASMSGTRVVLSNLSVDGKGAGAWNGEAAAPEARLRMSDGSIDARVVVRLGDGRPLAALLPAGPPKWVAGLMDLRDFDARGRVEVGPSRLTVSDARISSGSFELAGDYRERGKREWGALLVQKGALTLGVGLRESGTSLHLLGSAKWFAEQALPGGLRTAQPRDSEVAATRRNM